MLLKFEAVPFIAVKTTIIAENNVWRRSPSPAFPVSRFRATCSLFALNLQLASPLELQDGLPGLVQIFNTVPGYYAGG